MIKAVRETGQQVLWVCDPDARQHRDQLGRPQDAPLREHPQGTRAVVPGSRGQWIVPGRRAHRAHGRRRHRMHGRRARTHRCGSRACLQVHGRSAPQLRAGARDGDADRPAHAVRHANCSSPEHAVRKNRGSRRRSAHHHQSGLVAQRSGQSLHRLHRRRRNRHRHHAGDVEGGQRRGRKGLRAQAQDLLGRSVSPATRPRRSTARVFPTRR